VDGRNDCADCYGSGTDHAVLSWWFDRSMTFRLVTVSCVRCFAGYFVDA